MSSRRNWIGRIGAMVFAVALLGIWQLLSIFNVISPLFFPSPSRTLLELLHQVVNGHLWEPLSATVMRMIYGWVVASLLGLFWGR